MARTALKPAARGEGDGAFSTSSFLPTTQLWQIAMVLLPQATQAQRKLGLPGGVYLVSITSSSLLHAGGEATT